MKFSVFRTLNPQIFNTCGHFGRYVNLFELKYKLFFIADKRDAEWVEFIGILHRALGKGNWGIRNEEFVKINIELNRLGFCCIGCLDVIINQMQQQQQLNSNDTINISDMSTSVPESDPRTDKSIDQPLPVPPHGYTARQLRMIEKVLARLRNPHNRCAFDRDVIQILSGEHIDSDDPEMIVLCKCYHPDLIRQAIINAIPEINIIRYDRLLPTGYLVAVICWMLYLIITFDFDVVLFENLVRGR